MLPEIKNIIKSEAEKKYPECDFDSYENENKRKGYISGREEGIEEMLKFDLWKEENYWKYFINEKLFYNMVDNTLEPKTLPELYLEYKKL